MLEVAPILIDIAQSTAKSVAGALLQAAVTPVVRSAWRSVKGTFASAPSVAEPELVYTVTLPWCDEPFEVGPEIALRTFQPGDVVRFKDGGAITRVFTSLIYEDGVDRIRVDHDCRKELWPADAFEPAEINVADVRNFEVCPVCAEIRGEGYYDEKPYVYPGPIFCHDCQSVHSVWPTYAR